MCRGLDDDGRADPLPARWRSDGGTNTVAPESWAICWSSPRSCSPRSTWPPTDAASGHGGAPRRCGGLSVAVQSGWRRPSPTPTAAVPACSAPGSCTCWSAPLPPRSSTSSARSGWGCSLRHWRRAMRQPGRSVILGLCLFAERLGQGPVGTMSAVIGLVLVLAGIVTLVTVAIPGDGGRRDPVDRGPSSPRSNRRPGTSAPGDVPSSCPARRSTGAERIPPAPGREAPGTPRSPPADPGTTACRRICRTDGAHPNSGPAERPRTS